MRHSVGSEVGQLRAAILHRPGLELKRLTPSNKDDLLFDEILWVKRARQEHDAFAEALREAGVTVHRFDELLRQTVEVPEAKKHILDSVFDARVHGPMAVSPLRNLFDAMDDGELTAFLIGGISKREVLERIEAPQSIPFGAMGLDDMVLPPLPNTMFTRDTSAWIYGGVAINSMRKKARMRETIHYEAIYRYHPMFAGTGFEVWAPGTANGVATTEGGDILVIGRGAVLIGMSERTRPQGVERLAQRLLRSDQVRTLVALDMPKARAVMHLDTVMTMVNEDTFTKYAGLGMLPSYTIEPAETDKELRITQHEPEEMHDVIAAALGLDHINILTPSQDVREAEREQWDDGNNTLAIAPRLAVAYERNVVTNARLEDAGIEVLRIAGSELGSGRGGPRCMSCPIHRDPL